MLSQSIVMMGLNHVTAPISVREQVACTREELARALPQLISNDSPLTESLILSTCNRTEIYAVTDDLPRGENRLHDFFAARAEFSASPLSALLYTRHDREAARHILAVACGLDSMILGEFEILGQVREAYAIAAQQKTVGPTLSRLCLAAIHAGKRARVETGIGRGAASIAYAAVQLARQKLGNLKERRVLIVGTGEIGQRVARNLRGDGVSMLFVASRTADHADELARDLGARSIRFDALNDALSDADLIVSATGAPHIILDAAAIVRAMSTRPQRALCVIDLAVPRDVDPAAAQIPNVQLFDLDQLQSTARENMAGREEEIKHVEAIIDEEVGNFWHWYSARRAAPVIAHLHEHAESIRSAELAKALRRLGHLHLSERDRNVIAALSEGIVNKLLAAPTAHLKERVQSGNGQIYLDALRELFGLGQDDHGDVT